MQVVLRQYSGSIFRGEIQLNLVSAWRPGDQNVRSTSMRSDSASKPLENPPCIVTSLIAHHPVMDKPYEFLQPFVLKRSWVRFFSCMYSIIPKWFPGLWVRGIPPPRNEI